MHQIALLVALGATTGLFGGRHHVKTTCQGGNCAASSNTRGSSYHSYYQPTRYAQAPAQAVAAPVQSRAAYYHQPRYFYTAAPTCPNGQCYRR